MIEMTTPEYEDIVAFSRDQNKPALLIEEQPRDQSQPEPFAPNRDLNKVLTQLYRYGETTTPLADEPKILELAGRSIRTVMIRFGHFPEDHPVDFSDQQTVVDMAIYGILQLKRSTLKENK